MDKFTLREAEESDSSELVALCEQLGYHTDYAGLKVRLTAILSDTTQKIFIAENAESQILGWMHVFIATRLEVERFAEIGGIVVDECHRGERIGKTLMKSAEDWAVRNGVGVMRLRSNMLRTKAHQFYINLGYFREKQQQVFTKLLGRSSS